MTGRGASELDVESAMPVNFEEAHEATVFRVDDWLKEFGVDQSIAHEVRAVPVVGWEEGGGRTCSGSTRRYNCITHMYNGI